tara:strand:+ start:283 stop:1227 length:945 start_codon:yes stop_codon:yes gene_type:complete
MATSLSTSYVGEYKDKMIASALLSGKTLDNGGVTVYPNVAYKEVIKKIALGNDLMVGASCDYTDAGTVTISERVLEVKEFQINKTECKSTFAQDWTSAQMGYSVPNYVLPKSYADFISQQYIAKIAANVESMIWQGAAGANAFNGFTTDWAANASSLAGGAVVTGTTVTAANVVDEIGKVVDNVSANNSALLDKEDLHIYVSNHIYQMYVRSLGGFGAAGLGANGFDGKGNNQNLGEALLFDGIKIFRAPGMPTNDMAAAQKSNLFFGCGIEGDLSDIALIDTSSTLGDQNVRFVARFKAGIQTGLLEEVTYYT